ncbi:Predicted arabinose efflux permease, MFS family [Psychrobacillus psychrotolerans]|uniref:Predicted arabinose efflux permease, MFS family n=1 Tax=Psychrobacillus psychrotolerans TaxID=126156 RepID=A0A1I5ZPM3_9BACI|nr:MFS transporter [Psychrobacillus psychrotolerans]SFQ58355.1 Predicted arabinose efflux permease, MFS family [Psychrobacillus psychrotolerans]
MEETLKLKKATYHLWTFTVSKLVSTFGAQVYAFAISFYILQLTGSASSFALNLICSILPRTIVAPFAGYAADKYSRKMIVIVAQIATTIAIGGLLVVSLTMGLSLFAIYSTTVILSLTSLFSGVTFSSSITGLVDEGRIQKAMSLNQMSISFAAIGSPAVGGLLYGAVSMPVFLIMYMVASVIAVLLESTMDFKLFAKRKEVVEGEPKEPMLESMKAGLRYLMKQPILKTMVVISLFINFLFGAYQVGYSFILIEKLKINAQHFGFTEGAFAIGMLLLSIYFSTRKELKFPFLVSKWGIVVLGVLMGTVALPLLITMSSTMLVVFYIVLMFFFGATMMVTNTPIQVMMQKMIEDDYKGRVFSIIETCAMALMPLGMVLFGFLYDIFPAEGILIVSSMLLILVTLFLARPSVVRAAHPELGQKRVAYLKTES